MSKEPTTNVNTGDVFFQLVNLTQKITKIQQHLLVFKKDFSSKAILYKIVAKRKKFIKYLARTNKEKHQEYMTTYGLKKKAKAAKLADK